MTALLEVRGLTTSFMSDDGEFAVIERIDLSIEAGRTLGVVGESGCGKSVTSLSIMGLLPKGLARITAGSVMLDGVDLTTLSEREFRALRGNRIAMIFQEPMTSLNPAFTIGNQLIEAVLSHRRVSRQEARRIAIAMLTQVRIPAPAQRMEDHPHKLSGGMRQRVMIAMALVCEPRLLIADEPTTALDVTIQAQVLELMRQLRQQSGAAIMLITHDLGVIAELADDVVVMYAGRVVERATVEQLFVEPQHPYTIGLLGSVPRLGASQERLAAIEGQVPPTGTSTPGCRFAPRCPFVEPRCRQAEPVLRSIEAGHAVACWRAPLDVPADARVKEAA